MHQVSEKSEKVQVQEAEKTKFLLLERIVSKALLRIQLNPEEDLSSVREEIDYHSNKEVYFKLNGDDFYYHGELKRILGAGANDFTVELKGSDRPRSFQYSKLRDLIIIGPEKLKKETPSPHSQEQRSDTVYNFTRFNKTTKV